MFSNPFEQFITFPLFNLTFFLDFTFFNTTLIVLSFFIKPDPNYLQMDHSLLEAASTHIPTAYNINTSPVKSNEILEVVATNTKPPINSYSFFDYFEPIIPYIPYIIVGVVSLVSLYYFSSSFSGDNTGSGTTGGGDSALPILPSPVVPDYVLVPKSVSFPLHSLFPNSELSNSVFTVSSIGSKYSISITNGVPYPIVLPPSPFSISPFPVVLKSPLSFSSSTVVPDSGISISPSPVIPDSVLSISPSPVIPDSVLSISPSPVVPDSILSISPLINGESLYTPEIQTSLMDVINNLN